MPCLAAARWRRQICIVSSAWVAEGHGHYREVSWVLELCSVNAQPLQQVLTAGIVPGNSRCMNFGARCLAYEQNFALWMYTQHRTRLQDVTAQRAGPDLFGELGDAHFFFRIL